MKIYCMSDIHGCLGEFEEALSLVTEHLEEPDTMLVLLGDYVHRGPDGHGVLDKIMSLQKRYGTDKVVALLGNHDEWVITGFAGIDDSDYITRANDEKKDDDETYIRWLEGLPRYYTAGNTIFVHAGIDEDAGEFWEWCTGDDLFLSKYPAETGLIHGLSMKVVAGHVGTSELAGDPTYHDVFYDGASHYYIDGTVCESGFIPVLMVDTETDQYFQVTAYGNLRVLPYDD